jgi:WD40 repeat protein
LLLCCLEGKTQREAARELGWPLGSMSKRLSRARALLRTRLARRGVAPAGLLTAGFTEGTLSASLADGTVKAALLFAAGDKAAGGVVSANAAALAEGVLRAMYRTKLTIGMALVVVGLVGAGVGLLARVPAPAPVADQPGDRAAGPEGKSPVGVEKHADLYGDPLPPGAVVRLGSVHFWHGGLRATVVSSPDGKLLAAGASGTAGLAHVWDAATGKKVHQFPGGAAVAFAPDGKTLASGRGTIRIWDLATGKVVREFREEPVIVRGNQTIRRAGYVTSLAFSPDGGLLASGSNDGVVQLWEAATGKEVRRMKGGGWCVAFAPDGKAVASGCYDDLKGTVRVWEAATGNVIHELKAGRSGGAHWGAAVAFAPDGKALAAGTSDGEVVFWEAATGKEVRRIKAHEYDIVSIAFSPDGKSLASGARDFTLKLWDVENGKEVRRVTETYLDTDPGYTVTFTPDGKAVVSGGGPRLQFWDASTGKDLYPGYTMGVGRIAYLPDGKTLATGGVWQQHGVRLWDPGTGKERDRVEKGGTVAAVSADGKYLAAGGTDGMSMGIWDVATRKQVAAIEEQGGALGCFSADGKTLATVAVHLGPDRGGPGPRGHPTATYHLWDTATGQLVRQFPLGDFASGLAFTPDGTTLASSNHERTVCLWDTATGKEKLKFPGGGDGAAFSPDARMLATWEQRPSNGMDRTKASLSLFDAQSGKRRFTVEGAGGHAAFSPDGRLLAAVTDDRQTLGLWEACSGKEVCRFGGHERRPDWGLAHCKVNDVSFAPDGRTLASSSDDGTVLVWDVGAVVRGEKPVRRKLSPAELESIWVELADTDGGVGQRALWALVEAGAQGAPFLKERLAPVDADPKVKRLLADLENDSFEVRQKAGAELEKLGPLAEPALREALEGKPSLDVRRRVEELLAKLSGPLTSPERLRILRALTVLEQIGTAGERRLLERLAGGAPGAELTEGAKAALARLARRPADNNPRE